MVGDRRTTPLVYTLALRVVALSSWLAPRLVRGDWEREWRAELWHLYRSLEVEGDVAASGRAAFLLRSAGSIFDALQLRVGDTQLWGESVTAIVSGWRRRSISVTMALLFLSLGIAGDALLIALGRLFVGIPLSPWGSLPSELRFGILGIAIACGVFLGLTGAAAAAQLLGSADGSSGGRNRALVVETLLVAAVTGWVGRWFAAFGMHSAVLPHTPDWLASVDLSPAVTGAWLVSWAYALTVLTALRIRGIRRTPELPH